MSEDKKYYCGPSNIPNWMRKWASGEFNDACKIHDMDYTTKRVTQDQADATFLRNMLDKAGDSWWSIRKAYLMYKLVRIFGGSRYGKK